LEVELISKSCLISLPTGLFHFLEFFFIIEQLLKLIRTIFFIFKIMSVFASYPAVKGILMG
jgi:hypothetical protein